MNDRLECEIVRDLLPSYVDGLTSDVTNKAVEEHVEGCAACADVLSGMRAPEPPKPASDPEVDYLKKIRKTSKVGIVCGIVLMIIGMLTIYSKVYLIGRRAVPEEVNLTVSVSGSRVYVSGNFVNSANGAARLDFSESAGIVSVTVYKAPQSFLSRNSFSEEYVALSEVNAVRCDDLIIWENGVQIGHTAAKLYAAKNPFLGDMPSNGAIATILGIGDQFGNHSFELETSKEPYTWRVFLETKIYDDEESAARDIMTADSYAMLATVDNVERIEWEYETSAGKKTLAVTADEASAFAGKDIKKCADTPSELQAFISSLSIKWSGVREVLQEKGTFRVSVRNYTDAKIYGLSMDYQLGEKNLGSGGVSNADESAIKKGDELVFGFEPKNFPKDTTPIGLLDFGFTLYVLDEKGEKTLVCENEKLQAKYAWTYSYSLTGSYETGFKLTPG